MGNASQFQWDSVNLFLRKSKEMSKSKRLQDNPPALQRGATSSLNALKLWLGQSKDWQNQHLLRDPKCSALSYAILDTGKCAITLIFEK